MGIMEDKELIPIKTKVNDPFIYFLMEPNVVFVYRIETQKYLTVSNWIENSEWETYEINQCDEFELFDHEKNKPVEGKGFFVNQDELSLMVEEINTHIQRKRSKEKRLEQQGVVHIVTSESAAGTLRVGLERPKTVIGFPDSFSIGPLWKLNEKGGQTFRNEWLYENINFEMDDNVYENKFKNTLREIEDIPDEMPIHIWYANNADEQIGLRFYLYVLRNKENEILLLNATELNNSYSTSKDGEQPIFHTGQMEPQNLSKLFEQNKSNKPLSVKDRKQFQLEWETISQTKEVLRLWLNDEITGVPENYYDPLIIKTIEKLHTEQVDKDFINTGQVIGEIVMQSGVLVSLFFLEYRIRYLIYSGILELKGIPKTMRHYGVRLR